MCESNSYWEKSFITLEEKVQGKQRFRSESRFTKSSAPLSVSPARWVWPLPLPYSNQDSAMHFTKDNPTQGRVNAIILQLLWTEIEV
jgi:hypothetical protein